MVQLLIKEWRRGCWECNHGVCLKADWKWFMFYWLQKLPSSNQITHAKDDHILSTTVSRMQWKVAPNYIVSCGASLIVSSFTPKMSNQLLFWDTNPFGEQYLNSYGTGITKDVVLLNDSLWRNNPIVLSTQIQELGSKKSLIGSSRLVGTVSEGVLESLCKFGKEMSQMHVQWW